MSIRLMSAVWQLDLPATDKIVLIALADAANDEGVTWMAIKSRHGALDLSRKCGLAERTIQGAIARLGSAGLLSRIVRPGGGILYSITPAAAAPAPAPDAPSPAPAAPAPAAAAPTPAAAAGKPSNNLQYNHHREGSADPPGGDEIAPPRGRHLLPDGWTVPAAADLPPMARACAEQWTAASYETHGEAFAAYWRARRGMMADWRLAWANRVAALHGQVMRDQKFGNAPAAAASRTRWEPKTADDFLRAAAFCEAQGDHAKAADYRARAAGIEPHPAAGETAQAPPATGWFALENGAA